MAFKAGDQGHLHEHNDMRQFLDDVKDPNKKGQFPALTGPEGPSGPAGPGAEYQPDAPATRRDGTPLVVGDIWIDSDDFGMAYQLVASPTAPAAPINGQLWFDAKATILKYWDATGSTWVSMGVVSGPAGPQGPTGPIGPQGVQGVQGAKGDTGPVGPVGPTGATGAQGPVGPVGPAGPQGIQGLQGPQGTGLNLMGATADHTTIVNPAAGDIYLNTTDGDLYIWDGTKWNDFGHIQGPEGPQGPQGNPGPVGPAGPVGPTGADGPQGPIGPQGDKGDTGPQGTQGIQGIAGLPARMSAGPVTTGAAGTNAAATITAKPGSTTNEWVLALTIPQGSPGATGATGVQGPKGDTGAVGPIGPAGPAGTVTFGGATSVAAGSGSGGSSTNAARADHVHAAGPFGATAPLVAGTAAVGTADDSARSDHVHPAGPFGTTAPLADAATAAVGTANDAARSDHAHPKNTLTFTWQSLKDGMTA